ncbi:MAG: hypothetical protein KKE16_00500 [Firmicutes bacterium]|nr:hypothetical protein [Bacillota bacterium]
MKEQAYKEVVNWIYQFARPLELARFQYLFEGGTKENYYMELRKFQNGDGGFGYGLEPDSMNPNSSPIQTWMAFEYIEELNLTKTDSLIQDTVDYLVNTSCFENGFWFATIPTNEDYPHAPWWGYSKETRIWGYNPTAAIAGFIYKYAVKKQDVLFAKKIIQKAIDDFLSDRIDEMHEVRSFIEMNESIKGSNDFKGVKEFQTKLLEIMMETIEKDDSKWFSSYCVRPSQYIYKKDMLGYAELKEWVHKEASMFESQRGSGGVWGITWDWNQYPEDFQKAKIAWQGLIAVGTLKIIYQFR